MYFISNKNYNYSGGEVGSINYYAKKAYDDIDSCLLELIGKDKQVILNIASTLKNRLGTAEAYYFLTKAIEIL